MSGLSSGIQVSAALRASITGIKSTATRCLKVKIQNDTFVETGYVGKSSPRWEEDIDALAKMLDDKEPCFLVIVKDQGFLLLGYTPDAASVKDRMTYSSSKGSLKALLGDHVEDYFCTAKADVSTAAYRKRKAVKGPMSYVEEQLAELPKQLDKSDAHKSAGFGLLAALSGKGMPATLRSTGGPFSPGSSSEHKGTPSSPGLRQTSGPFSPGSKPDQKSALASAAASQAAAAVSGSKALSPRGLAAISPRQAAAIAITPHSPVSSSSPRSGPGGPLAARSMPVASSSIANAASASFGPDAASLPTPPAPPGGAS